MRAVVTPEAATVDTTPLAPPIDPVVAPLQDTTLETDSADDTDASQEPGWMRRAARNAIAFWKTMVAVLAAGYQAGFLWVAAVGVYLLMRRDIDGVQLHEVYVDPADEYGLPPLADEATGGVPEVAPNNPAQRGSTNAI
jgi:hypothetical protein